MKKKSLLLLLLIYSINSFTQNSIFSIETSYPIVLNKQSKDSFSTDYTSIIDIGIKSNLTENKKIDIAIGINATFLKSSTNYSPTDPYILNHIILQPKVFGIVNLIKSGKLKYLVGLGYSFDIDSTVFTKSGFNFNTGIKYLITKKIFFHTCYDLIMFGGENYSNGNLSLVKVGIGIKI